MSTSTPSQNARIVRVALDGNFLSLPYSGIGTYVRELSNALDADREELGIQVDVIRPGPGRCLNPGSRAHRFAWDAFGVSVAVARRKHRPDVLHLPQMSAPVVAPLPCVVTIHDVIPLLLHEYRRSRAMKLYLGLMSRTVRWARQVIVPSQSAAAEVERVLAVEREKLVVIHEAASADLVPDGTGMAGRQARHRFGIPGPYLFNIGGFDRRKNVPLLVEAFAAALSSLPDRATLVIAGAPHSGNTSLFPPIDPIIRRLGLAARVLMIGRVSNDDRRTLYQGAVACVTPSMHEGFGLTPLEAMACGTPAIVANRTSLPEVIGNAGLIVEPEVDALAQALTLIMTDDHLRQALSALGLARAGMFSWKRAARETASVYRDVVSKPDYR